MCRSVELTIPIPSAEEVADRLGIKSAARRMLCDPVDGSSGKVVQSVAARKEGRPLGSNKTSRKGAQTSRWAEMCLAWRTRSLCKHLLCWWLVVAYASRLG